jgi:hypothetical protein
MPYGQAARFSALCPVSTMTDSPFRLAAAFMLKQSEKPR